MSKEKNEKILLSSNNQTKDKNIYSQKAQEVLKYNREKRLEVWKKY